MSLSTKLPFTLLLTTWASQLNPFLANPVNQVSVLENVVLKTGVNVVNHKLGETLQGWFIVDRNAAAEIYRSAPFNDLTLTLTSSAPVTVNLGVF